MKKNLLVISLITATLLLGGVVFASSVTPYYVFKPIVLGIDNFGGEVKVSKSSYGKNEAYEVDDLKVVSPSLFGQDILIFFDKDDINSFSLRTDKEIVEICYYNFSEEVCGFDIEVTNPRGDRVYVRPYEEFGEISDTFYFQRVFSESSEYTFQFRKERFAEDIEFNKYLQHIDNKSRATFEEFNISVSWNEKSFVINAANIADFSPESVAAYEEFAKNITISKPLSGWTVILILAVALLVVLFSVYIIVILLRKIIEKIKTK